MKTYDNSNVWELLKSHCFISQLTEELRQIECGPDQFSERILAGENPFVVAKDFDDYTSNIEKVM